MKGSDSSDTDDEELQHRIRQKQDAFRRKEREEQQLQERLALEVQTIKGRYIQSVCMYISAANSLSHKKKHVFKCVYNSKLI